MKFSQFVSRPAAELFVAKQVTSLDPRRKFLNVKFSPRASHLDLQDFRGCGLYAMGFQGRLIYVGEFCGLDSEPFAGNILKMRWMKHLSSVTLRGVRVGSKLSAVTTVYGEHPDCPMLGALAGAPEGFIGRLGFEASKNRLRFASRNWSRFDEPALDALLEPFTFSYVRLLPGGIEADPSSLRNAIGLAEDDAIAEALPLINNGMSWVDPEDRPHMESVTHVLRDSLSRRIADLVSSGSATTRRKGVETSAAPGPGRNARPARNSRASSKDDGVEQIRSRIADGIRATIREPHRYRVNRDRRDAVVTICATGRPVHVHIDVTGSTLTYRWRREGETGPLRERPAVRFTEEDLPHLVTQWCP